MNVKLEITGIGKRERQYIYELINQRITTIRIPVMKISNPTGDRRLSYEVFR